MAASTGIITGSLVWVEHPIEAWIDGEVVQVNGEQIIVNCADGKTVTTSVQSVYPIDLDAPSVGVDDMTKIAYLHEPGVLMNLRTRFEMDEIYTYTGQILIAVNPFQRLPHLYDKNVIEQYRGVPMGELDPHPFAIADAAYRQMINEGINQSILVSGESGAGKTESTKMLMRYLAYMGGRSESEGPSVEQQVLESNPVLEAFGNAKTDRNNNSSRFGKFVELQFDDRGKISGAAIRTYLLERSRVCQVSGLERNYHCFYMLCAAPAEDVNKYKLAHPRTFHYLNQSDCIQLDAIDDAEEYIAIRRAMEVIGMSPEEQDAIFRVVASVLHLGNIEFSKGIDSDAAEPKDDQSLFHLQTVAELLMCDENALEDSLCKRFIVTRGERITKYLDPEAAAISRDSLAKVVYSRLFDWLVNKINDSIGQDPDSKYFIGVLDIYGFESFKINSFEQFCINLTNEKLQQHFNQHVFKMEQEEYEKEEIDWSYVDFVDNQDILDLIEKKPGGIVALLDEACILPRSTHETFAEKLYQSFTDHKCFSKPKLSRTDFTIHHYAGDVTYQTDYFLDKNKDYVVGEHQALLGASRCSFVSSLFPPLAEESSKSSKFSSICTRFKQQLQLLLETLNATEPHYVRCVKPNNLLQPFIFENQNVLQQLRCGGVMEAIRISCDGFPTRMTFDEFLCRFDILGPDDFDSIGPEVIRRCTFEVAVCMKLLEKVNLEGYQIGKTKVFLRAGQMAQLDACKNKFLADSASVIQKNVRSLYARRNFITLRNASIPIQAICRGIVARSFYESFRREVASVTIQKTARMLRERESYEILCSAVVPIQTRIRGMVAHRVLRLRRRTKAAIVIQSHCRRYLVNSFYLREKWATIATQCAWRRSVAIRELRKRKLAAAETATFQQSQTDQENRVEELILQLKSEKRIRADMEKAKSQEIAKLQSALEDMELRFQKNQKVNDQEVARNLIAEKKDLKALANSLEKQLHETEHKYEEAVNSLEKHLHETEKKHEETVNSLEKRLHETEKKYEETVNSLEKQLHETEKKYEETSKQVTVAETLVIQLKTSMQRLEERRAEAEATDQLTPKPMSLLSPKPMSLRSPKPMSLPSPKPMSQPSPLKAQGSLLATPSSRFSAMSSLERQREQADALIKCVKQNLGFSNGKPVASYTIYKCLIHWKSFEAEKTNVFDRLIDVVSSAIEARARNDLMAYWLSNTSALLFLLQHTMKSADKPPQPTKSFFGRMFKPSNSSANLAIGGFEGVKQVEGKHPAILFKEQLTLYVDKIYGIIRDNVKKDLSSLISSYIKAPTTSVSPTEDWKGIIKCLDELLGELKENYVPEILVQKILTQLFSFINEELLNSLLLHKEYCTFSNGQHIKVALGELEIWCSQNAGPQWEELQHIRQTIGFLVIGNKSAITCEDLATDLCPVLTIQQQYRICTLYWDGDNDTSTVNPEVTSSMKAAMIEEFNEDDTSSFLLDDNSSMPISIEDICGTLYEMDFKGVKPTDELAQNPDFKFLLE